MPRRDAPAENYEVDVQCGSDYFWDGTYAYTGAQNVKTWTIDPITGPESSCTIDAFNISGTTAQDETTFDVAVPPLVLDHVSPTGQPFYPRVHDGYKDTTKTSFRISQRATVNISVTNSHGSTVRRASFGSLRAGNHSWVWNGKSNSGNKVALGTYHVHVTATADRTRHGITKAVVATGWRTKSNSGTREGREYSSAASRGSCFISHDVFSSVSEDLDCWGGKYAIAKYRFTIPATAKNLSWDAQGHKDSDDICCRGVITKSGKRLDAKHFLVTVKVTGWRAYVVKYADVYYKYKVRI
jgi:hypothetical protein